MKTNRPQLTVLSLAISAALTSMVPLAATAQTVISQNETATQQWDDSDFTVNPGVSLSIANPSSAAIYTGGSIVGTLSNHGTISSQSGGIVVGSTQIGMLSNSGAILAGSFNAITNNNGTTIQTLDNSGTISGNFGGIYNNGVIDVLNNDGTIKSRDGYGVDNDDGGSIGAFNNSGAIDTLRNSGTIDSLFNHGGTITTLLNTIGGTITGSTNGSGVFNGGLITNASNSGDIHGTIGISNGGVLGTGTTSTSYVGTIGTLSNSGTISGISNAGDGVGIINGLNSTIGKLINQTGGTITGILGISNTGTITTLENDGTISAPGTPSLPFSTGIFNTSTIVSLTNGKNGVITDGEIGIANAPFSINVPTIDTLTNNGIIKGNIQGIYNFGGVIATLTNNGTIEGGNGILNVASDGAGIQVLNNNSLIHGTGNGISNASDGAIGTVNNSGIIVGDSQAAIGNSGVIDALNNKAGGTIQNGVFNYSGGTITSLDNKGRIAGFSTSTTAHALYSEGLIGSLNNSGVIISAVDAIYLDVGSTLGAFTNSGTVAGKITNLSGQALSINGGSGSKFGLLTGSSGGKGVADIGQIDSANTDVIFSSGNQLLNDHIDVGSNNVVSNAGGVLQVNNQININGSYHQNTAATLNIGVTGGAVTNGDMNDVGYGRLVVSGSAVIDAGSSVMLKKNGAYGFANGQRYLVVQANSTGTDYNEETLRYGATGFNGSVTGNSIADGSNLDLVLTLDGGTANQATNSNAQSSLDGLFRYTGTDEALMNLFNAAAAIDSSAEGNRAGSQMNPSSGAAGVAGSSTAVFQQVNNIAFNRLNNAVPQGGGSGGVAGGASSGISGGDGMSDSAAWGQAFGGRASDDGRDGVSGYHASYTGLLVGADTALNDRWRAGGLFSYATTSVSNDGNNDGSFAHVDSYGLTAYAGYTGEPWFVNMSVGAMRSDVDARRVVDFTGFNGIANSSYNGMQYVAAVQAGYPLAVNDMIVTPLAGLTYSSLKLDGYTETGGNGAALRVDGSDTHSVKSDLGVRLERAYKTSYGLLKPTAQLLWRHEYSDTRLQSVANFAADTSGATSFVSEGPKPVEDTGVLSLGLTLLRNDNLTLSVNYTLEQGGGYTSQAGDLLARWRF